MAEDIQKIKTIARQNTFLTAREEIDFVTVLHQSKPNNVRSLRKLFEEDPRWVERFYQIYQAKKRAISDRDTDAWDAVIQREVTEFGLYGE